MVSFAEIVNNSDEVAGLKCGFRLIVLSFLIAESDGNTFSSHLIEHSTKIVSASTVRSMAEESSTLV